VALFVLGYFIQGRELVEMLLLAIALGVAAIPEGLPAITTITLALGVQRIAQKNALIKHLPSAETLGATTVICSDKTGTLTKNEMTVEYVYADEKLYHVSGVGYSPRGNVEWNNAPFTPENGSGLEKAIQCGVHSNNAQYSPREATILGDPTEGAMVVLGHKTGIVTQWERVKEIPFTSARKQMTTIHAVGGKAYRIFSKGAVERILDGCSFVLENGKKIPLTQGKKQQIQTQTNTLAASAYRVLGCAYLDTETIPTNPETNLVFVGLLALRDPPREEAKGAIATCVGAGIQVKMITGDHPLTAKAIAERLGLEGEVITGEQINGMSDAELNEVVRTHAIFARVDPEHKYRIVERLQQSGHVVAVTGDGVNDAPAIKKADIGIAMGIKGTDVAKEASDMVLRDDNFATIVNAVELGRTIYANLQGFVRYLLGANLAEILVVATGFFLAAGEVLTPIQLLWINLVTDAFPALALGEDPPTKDVMRKKPRPKSAGILDQMGSFIVVSGLIGSIVTLFAFFHGLRMGETYAGTMAFTMIVVFELVLVFNAREEGKTMLEHSPFTNLWLILAVGLSLGLQLMAIYVPWLAPFFGTVPLSGEDWVLIGGLSLFALLVPKISHFWNTHRGAHLVEGVSP
ncbi:MAG: HAD-IC family P-type ATPase, partial [archaeon]|nr:HAD-IC family P-type ATPase [archaeon]